MNCLLYARVNVNPKIKPRLSWASLFAAVETGINKRGRNIVGRIIDLDESVECANDAKFPNLRNYLAKHNDVDVVVAATKPEMSLADYAAFKHILDQHQIGLRIMVMDNNTLPCSKRVRS